mmetsp:Transcript_28571/g.67105  ORF Transcript_28571/g.67105 Transcript_28571/m.67105 type:complete len:212 (-) Transcript_28571:125-760(-)
MMGHTALDTPGCASLQYQDPRNQNEAPHLCDFPRGSGGHEGACRHPRIPSLQILLEASSSSGPTCRRVPVRDYPVERRPGHKSHPQHPGSRPSAAMRLATGWGAAASQRNHTTSTGLCGCTHRRCEKLELSTEESRTAPSRLQRHQHGRRTSLTLDRWPDDAKCRATRKWSLVQFRSKGVAVGEGHLRLKGSAFQAVPPPASCVHPIETPS